jgi:hypothetical protein
MEQHNDLDDAPNIRHGGVSLPPAFKFEVGAICTHFGVLIGKAAQSLSRVVLAPSRYSHGHINDGNTWGRLVSPPERFYIRAQEGRQLLSDICHLAARRFKTCT